MNIQKISGYIKRLETKVQELCGDEFRGIYLFGSQVRGDADENSDIDLLLVFETKPSWQQKNLILDVIADFEIETGLVIDAKLYGEGELNGQWTPFRETVLTQGVFHGV